MDGVKVGLLTGGVAAIAFIVGQILAWRQLVSAGYFVATSPASSFFYLITATHGLHLLGGLAALGRTVGMVIRHAAASEVRLSVELCTIYWHLLLLIWLLCFSLLLLT
jgi:cytochrome c oxidase subunit 3